MPKERPGLVFDQHGYEQVVPIFADDYDATAPVVIDDGEDGEPTLIDDPIPALIDDEDDEIDDRGAETGDAAGDEDAPTIAQRLATRARGGPHQRRGAMASVTRLPAGPFVLYLCSGPLRAGDLTESVRGLSNASVITVDTTIGGYSHDLTDPKVVQELIELGKAEHCVGVIFTPPCGTWSAARFAGGANAAPVVRDRWQPEGIKGEDGKVATSVQRANLIVQGGLRVIEAAHDHGAPWIIENPVSRAEGSAFAIKGRENHSCLFDYPPMQTAMEKLGGLSVVFDQGAIGAPTQKTTQLMCSPAIHAAVMMRFGPLISSSKPDDPSLLGDMDEDGTFNSAVASTFPVRMNVLLAEAILDPSRPEGTEWPYRMAANITPHYDPYEDSGRMLDIAYRGLDDCEDMGTCLSAIAEVAMELDSPLMTDQIIQPLCAVYAAHEASSAFSKAEIGQAFAVSQQRKGDTDNPSYGAATKGGERQFWLDACDAEIDNLTRHHAYEEVPEDTLPTWNASRGAASEVINILWVLKKKYNELRELLKYKARAVLDGRHQKSEAERAGQELNTFAPTVRHSTWRSLITACRARWRQLPESARAKRKRRTLSADVEGAYLQGVHPEGTTVYARPPPGARSHTRHGIPIVWRLTAPLYGEADAGRLWNLTFHRQMMDQSFTQSDADPCYYYKVYPDGSRLDIVCYVDDLWCEDDAGAYADADYKLMSDRFKMEFNENPTHFLGMNVSLHADDSITITCEAYAEGMADKYLPGWKSMPSPDSPADALLRQAYERAQLREVAPTPAFLKSYGGKVGALIYAAPCARPEVAQAINLCARALTFPTEEMDRMADRIMLYLAHHSKLGITYDPSVANAGQLVAYSDSDWAVGHSTTGFILMLCGAAIVYSSKRQGCVAMSSTEAEIIAASTCSLEVIFVRTLLAEMGLPQDQPTPLAVDNSGAVELSKDRKSCGKTRHIDRRYFKVRELMASGQVVVRHLPTDLNVADLLTKALPMEAFLRHRAACMNLPPHV